MAVQVQTMPIRLVDKIERVGIHPHMTKDEQRIGVAISQVLKRLADHGWVSHTVIRPGRLHVEYTDLGKEKMHILKGIFIDELHVSLTYDQFEGLTALLLAFEKTPEASSEDLGTR